MSASIVPDIIIQDSVPSIAVMLGDEKSIIGNQNLASFMRRAKGMSEQFRYAVVIMIGIADDYTWNYFQTLLDGDLLRIFRVSDKQAAASLIVRCAEVISDKDKSVRQAAYFEEEERKLRSVRIARSIVSKAFNELDVPQVDQQLLMEGFPSIAKLATTPTDEIRDNSPASVESITSITQFFRNPTTGRTQPQKSDQKSYK